MKYIVYGKTRVMTGNAIAEAVLAYAAALGQNGTTDVVDVPTSDEYGVAVTAELLLGPATQVMVEAAPENELEPTDEGLVAELVRRTAAVGGARFVEAASGHSQNDEASQGTPAPGPNDPFPTKSRPER